MSPDTTIISWLDDLNTQRRALKMTLPALATRSGLSRATVRRVLRDKSSKASVDSVLAIAAAVGARFHRRGTAVTIKLRNPKRVIDDEIRAQVGEIVRLVQGSMSLEGQGLTSEDELTAVRQAVEREIRLKPLKQLWGRPCRYSSRSLEKRR